jgi:TRAP-type C4-dicarboxylate transport system permease small subunit
LSYSAFSILKDKPRGATYIWISWLIVACGLIAFSASVSDRFSAWTSRYALFLLLWTGFIGASMATSRGGHLRIDAVRKTLPERMIGRYNTLSFLVAALSSAVFCWLSFIYTLRRFGADTTEGEIPDWIKVLAIPVSMFFIALRFSGRAWLSAIGQPDTPADDEDHVTVEVTK